MAKRMPKPSKNPSRNHLAAAGLEHLDALCSKPCAFCQHRPCDQIRGHRDLCACVDHIQAAVNGDKPPLPDVLQPRVQPGRIIHVLLPSPSGHRIFWAPAIVANVTTTQPPGATQPETIIHCTAFTDGPEAFVRLRIPAEAHGVEWKWPARDAS